MTTCPPSISKFVFAHRRSQKHVRAICSDYATFERRKQEWASTHPGSTPAEYTRAVQRIARECGV